MVAEGLPAYLESSLNAEGPPGRTFRYGIPS
jgi:hypothetical protein